MTQTETRYGITENKMLAIKSSFEMFEYEQKEAKNLQITDHKALEYI